MIAQCTFYHTRDKDMTVSPEQGMNKGCEHNRYHPGIHAWGLTMPADCTKIVEGGPKRGVLSLHMAVLWPLRYLEVYRSVSYCIHTHTHSPSVWRRPSCYISLNKMQAVQRSVLCPAKCSRVACVSVRAQVRRLIQFTYLKRLNEITLYV